MNNDNQDINKVDSLQEQFDRISSSYITVTNDMDNIVNSMYDMVSKNNDIVQALQSKVASLEKDTLDAITANRMTIQHVAKRQETFEGDMSSLHTWTEDTQQRLDGSVIQISLLSEKFDWFPEYYHDVHRYQIGDHIITFKKKLNWFRRLIIKLIFGSCEIR